MLITEKKFIQNNLDSGLMLISTPTGSGKSFIAQTIICENIIESMKNPSSAEANRRYIYITPRKNNLADAFDLNNICKMLKKYSSSDEEYEEREKYVLENFLFLKSNMECVLDFFKGEKDIKKIKSDEIYNSMQLETLLQAIKQRTLLLRNGMFTETDQINLANAERNFRKYVGSKLLEYSGKQKNRAKELIMDKSSKWAWIKEIYPASMIYNAKYIVMSMDKFQNPIDPIYDGSFLMYNDDTFAGAILFMDEFDSCYDTILKKIVEDGTRSDAMIDMIALFRKISFFLNQAEWPDELFRTSSSQIEEKYRKYPLELKSRADEINSKYHLECQLKCESNECKSYVFFHDDFNTWVNNGNKKKAFIHYYSDDAINKIVFYGANETPVEGDLPIETLVNDLDGFFKFFSFKASNLAKNYTKQIKSVKDSESAQAFEAALHSFLNIFDIPQESAEMTFIENLIRDHGRISKKKNKNKSRTTHDMTFYEKGIKYYTLINNEHKNLSTKINLACFARTPEKFILNVCSRYKVIGLSATGTIDSGIGNFDLAYLKMKLKNKYVIPSREDVERMRMSFEKNQEGYKDVPIVTELIGPRKNSGYTPELWMNLFQKLFESLDNDKRSDLDQNIEVYANYIYNELEMRSLDNPFYKTRYYKIAYAYSIFLVNPLTKSFLCMLNKFPKKNDILLDLNILHFIFEMINHFLGFYYDQSSVVVLTSEAYSEQKNQIEARLSKNEKLFVISSYQTIGSGQNLQYRTPEEVETIKINERVYDRKDFDGIYVENPTHVITNIRNSDGTYLSASQVAYGLFERENLYEKNELSKNELKQENEDLFANSVFTAGSDSRNKYNKTNINSLPGVCKQRTRIIMQAIGRICRTSNKNKQGVIVLADYSLAELMDTDCTKDMILNKEMEALVNIIETARKANGIIMKETDCLTNEANKKIYRVRSWINNALNTINREGRNLSDEVMEAWESSSILLKHPTGSREETDAIDNGTYWIELPEESDCLRYIKDNDSFAEDINLFDPTFGNRVVSEEDAFLPQLMSYDFIRKYFEEKKYKTKWEKAKCIMTPTAFVNLYKGRLGEAVGECCFKELFGVELNRIRDGGKYEKMDFLIKGTRIYVDTKLWHVSMKKDRDIFIEEAKKKKEICDADYVIFVNIMNDEEDIYHDYEEIDDSILLVPALLPMDCSNRNVDWAVRTRNKIMEVINHAKHYDE